MMTKIKMSRGKFAGINACADERGIIAALAVDHRGYLLQAIADARGEDGTASAEDMLAFKTTVTQVLTRHTSAVLLDPEYSLAAMSSRVPGTGVLLAYEKSGYDSSVQDRLPDLLLEWSVRRLIGVGAQAIKVLLYYNPVDEELINVVKQAYIERIGAECIALDVPFFLEPLVYDNVLGDENGLVFARKKPDYVARAIQEFSKPEYAVDVLKVEVPINPAFLRGSRAFKGEGVAYSRQQAIEHFRTAARATTLPFIFLSAGVTEEVFCEMLELAAEGGVQFSGVLCGRVTWQGGIAVYANEGVMALRDWLEVQGTQNVQTINKVLARCATPWWDVYGGRDKIEVTG